MYYSQSYREAESNKLAVKTPKHLIRRIGHNSNLQLAKALLSYRTTKLTNGFSPAKMLMGSKMRNDVLILSSKLRSKVKTKEIYKNN